MIFLLLSAALVGLLTLAWFLQRKLLPRFLPPSHPPIPGLPRTHPTLGNIPELTEAGSLPAFLTALHGKHGPIAGFWFGEVYTVSICHPRYYKITERMFDRHPSLFEVVKPLISSLSIQYDNGEHGRDRYRLFSRAFSQSANSQLLPQVVQVTQQQVEHLPEQVALHASMMSLAITVITQCHFGGYCQKEDNVAQLQKAYQEVFEDFDDAILGKWVIGQGEPRQEQFEENIKNFRDIVREMVKAHRERKESGEYDHAPFLDILLDHVDEEDDVVAQAISFLVGGFHTTGMFLTFVFYYICLYPKVQEKMRKEIQSVLGEEELVSMEQVDKLQYVKKVMDETLRIARVAIFSERLVTEDTPVDGYVLKAGTQVLNALSVTLADKEFFPNPEEFDPDRPCAEKGLAFCPFGFGVRKCPGYRLANLEMSVAAVEVLRRYRLEVDPGADRVQPVFGFIAKPEREIWVKATKV